MFTYLCNMDMIYTIAEIDDVAQSLMKKFASKSVWAFHAPMGAGKTTLLRAALGLIPVAGDAKLGDTDPAKLDARGRALRAAWASSSAPPP